MTTENTKLEDIALVGIVLAIWRQRIVFYLISAVFMAFGVFLFINTKTELTLTFQIFSNDYDNLPHTKEWNGLITLLDARSNMAATPQGNESSSASGRFYSEHKIQPLSLLAEYHVLFSQKQRVRKAIKQTLETAGGLSGEPLERAIATTSSNISVGNIYKINDFTQPNARTVSINTTDPLLARKVIERISTEILLEIRSNLANRTAGFVNMLEKSVISADKLGNEAAVSMVSVRPIMADLRATQKSLVAALPDFQIVAVDYDYPNLQSSSKRLQLLILFSVLGIFLGAVIGLIIQTIRQSMGINANSN